MITRGIKRQVNRFIDELSAKYLPYTCPAKIGQFKRGDQIAVQVAVRPIQLWEVVFPKEHLEIMQNTLFQKWGSKPQHSRHQKHIFALRKALGVKKLPKYEFDPKKVLPVYEKDVERTGIGYKEDYDKDGLEML